MKKLLFNKADSAKNADIRFSSRTYGWQVINRYDSFQVNRHDDVSALQVMQDGKWIELGLVDDVLQKANFIIANNKWKVWAFVRGNGSYVLIEPSEKFLSEDGSGIKIYEYFDGICVFCLDKGGVIASRTWFNKGWRKDQSWFFQNVNGIYRLQIVNDGRQPELYPLLVKRAAYRRWYWPFWKF